MVQLLVKLKLWHGSDTHAQDVQGLNGKSSEWHLLGFKFDSGGSEF
jgi:hypothetical protein